MKVSYFESVRYVTPQHLPARWPLPPGFYEPEAGEQAFQNVLDRLAYIEELGFDWVSVSEHHYSARILSPSPIVMAAHLSAHLPRLKIAVLGPIMPLNNPVRVAEELAMLDNLTKGRLIVGMLRGTTNEYLVYGVKPEEARERTSEGMELVLKAWTEPYPFGWKVVITSTARFQPGRVLCNSRFHRRIRSGPVVNPVSLPPDTASAWASHSVRLMPCAPSRSIIESSVPNTIGSQRRSKSSIAPIFS